MRLGGGRWPSRAQKIASGYCVVIKHTPRKIVTFYAHLEKLLVAPKQPIKAGDPIGIIGLMLDGLMRLLEQLKSVRWRYVR